MKRCSFGLSLGLIAGIACAAAEDEPHAPPPAISAAQPASTPASAVRLPTFAAASAPLVRRLTPEQREEWRFLKEASASGRFEMDASKLALSRSTDSRVRSLATALVNHHGATQPRLQQMLGARGMAPPMLANDQRKALNRLSKLQGTKFDREWTGTVNRSQQDAVVVYEKAAQGASDPALKAWIEEVLPTLRVHAPSGSLAYKVTAPAANTR